MRLFRCKRALVLLGLLVLILIVVIPLIVFLVLAEQKGYIPGGVRATPRISQAPGGAKSWPVISRNVPVCASSATEPPSDANDGDYNASWRSKGTPAWLAMIAPMFLLPGVAKCLLYGITRHLTTTLQSGTKSQFLIPVLWRCRAGLV